jgi:hypothetical protein
MISKPIAIATSCLFLLFEASVLAQEKKTETQTADDGRGGKITTTYSSHDGKNFVEKVHRDAKGKLLDNETEVSGPDGSVEEIENYDWDGSEQLTSRCRYEKDRSGNIVGSRIEYYKHGILVEGSIAVLRPGDKYQTTVKKWNILKDRYVDVPPEEQEKERATWKKWEERFQERKGVPSFLDLFKLGKVKYEGAGTGETIGHVADLKVQNISNGSLDFFMPAAVVESKSGQYQDYAVPQGQDVALKPGETKTVPLDGTCLERDKPPQPPGQTGDLVYNDAEPGAVGPDFHMAPAKVRDILDIVEPKYQAVDKLVDEDAFKEFPYHDKKEQKEIALQWSTWGDPRISDLVHSPPATKEDFKRNIDKQAEEHGPVTREKRKKLDKGTDALWDGIELTNEKAKDLEQPPSAPLEVSDKTGEGTPSPSPAIRLRLPLTKEQQGYRKILKDARRKWDDWRKKQKAMYLAFFKHALAQQAYQNALKAYIEKNKDHQEFKAALEKAKEKAEAGGSLSDVGSAQTNLEHLEEQLKKDFPKTPEGQKLSGTMNDTEKAAKQAISDEQEAKKASQEADEKAANAKKPHLKKIPIE